MGPEMTVVWILAALLLAALAIPSHRLLVRRLQRRGVHARIRRRLHARVGSLDARPSPARIPDRFRR